MATRQFGNPLLIKDDIETPLIRFRADERGKSEDWLQALLFKHPDLIPVNEIDPAFGPLIPLARELRTPSGPVDLLCINAKGHITLVETKLWRNPEARRQVVGQIIDYATEISRWTYRELVAAVRAATGSAEPDPLIAVARDAAAEEFSEADFTDTLTRNLARGRLLLLIVGDGIHEGVEHMAEFLQRAPQLGFTLGLVELALFKTDVSQDNSIFVQPRIVARTREITRAVVEIRSSVPTVSALVTMPNLGAAQSSSSTARRPVPLSEALFLEGLRNIAGEEVATLAKLTLAEAGAHGLEVDGKASAGPILKYTDESGEFFNFGQIRGDGKLGSSNRFSQKCVMLGLPQEIWRDYYQTVVGLIPGSQRLPLKEKGTNGEFEWIASSDGDFVSVGPLLRNREQWLAAIDVAVDRLRSELARRLP